MHISVSNFAAIFKTSGMCYKLHRALYSVKQEEFFFFHFFVGIFWAATLQIISETFGTKFTKTNTKSGFLSKGHPISKKKLGQIEVWMWEVSLI